MQTRLDVNVQSSAKVTDTNMVKVESHVTFTHSAWTISQKQNSLDCRGRVVMGLCKYVFRESKDFLTSLARVALPQRVY